MAARTIVTASTSPAWSHTPVGLVLAGGRATRMGGGDKPLRALGQGTLVSALLERLAPQCAAVIINTSSDAALWHSFGVPLMPDTIGGFEGPLAGILAGLQHLQALNECGFLCTVPGDTPFVPEDLVARLALARVRAGTPVACAVSGGRAHYAVALWPASLAGPLAEAMAAGIRSVRVFQAAVGCAEACWSSEPYDPFFNVNTDEDLHEAERIAKAHGPAAPNVSSSGS